MKCLILAAGYATRLYPLTENFPKPLLKVGEKTILDWLIDDIDTAGLVDQYVVISNHKFSKTGHLLKRLPSSTTAPPRTRPASARCGTSSSPSTRSDWTTTCW